MSDISKKYLLGLFQIPKKNMERMAEVLYDNESYYTMLSGADVVAVLKDMLPRRAVTEEEIFRQLEERHKRRQAAIDSAYRKQNVKEQLARSKIM